MVMFQITPEQWRTVEQGLPLPVKSPTNEECVILQKKVFDELKKLSEVERSDWTFIECGKITPLP